MILLLDNFDSFSYILVDYFRRLNVDCMVLRNDTPVQELTGHNFKGIVLSPGPKTPEKAGNLMEVLSLYHQKLPVLGICLGHQAIGQFFGGQVTKALRPVHGKISAIRFNKDIIFQGIPSSEINVVRYNSLVVRNLPDVLEAIALSKEEEIMALKHKHLPIWGVQFHPEAELTEFGLVMLKNWVTYNQIAV